MIAIRTIPRRRMSNPTAAAATSLAVEIGVIVRCLVTSEIFFNYCTICIYTT